MLSHQSEVEQSIIVQQDRFVWETPAFVRLERGPKWFLFMSLAAIFLIAYAIWTANFLFAFIIMLATILIFIASSDKPRIVLAQLGDNGVVWDGRIYLYRDLQNFAIIYQPPIKVLYIEPKNPVLPRLRISLEDQDPVAIREHLCQYVTEDLDLRDEHLSDIFARLLKL